MCCAANLEGIAELPASLSMFTDSRFNDSPFVNSVTLVDLSQQFGSKLSLFSDVFLFKEKKVHAELPLL